MVFTFAVTSQSKRIFVFVLKFYNNNSRSGSFEDQGQTFYVSLKEV